MTSANAEERVATAAINGVFVDFLDREQSVVRGEYLRKLAWGLANCGEVLGILVRGARIEGPLDLSFCDFGRPVCLEDCDIEDLINISGATLSAFSINRSRFRRVWGTGARVIGDVTFAGAGPLSGSSEQDEIAYIRLRDARIGGCVSGRGTTRLVAPNAPHPLSRRRVDALELQGADIGSAVLLDEGFAAEGAVWMLGARIGGNLDLAAAKVTNPNGVAVCGELATFRGTIQLVDGFQASGQVSFTGARIVHNWNMRRSSFRCDNGPALDLESAIIEGQLKAFENEVTGPITLAGAKIGRLLDDPNTAWGTTSTNQHLDLSELTYERIGFLRSSNVSIWKQRRDWLRRSNKPDRAGFSRQPYEQLARALAYAGHAEEAREISREAHREVNRRRSALPKAMVWIFAEQMFGYGLSPFRAAVTAILLWLCGWLGAEAMTSRNLLVDERGEVCNVEPALFALDVAVPILDLRQETLCTVGYAVASSPQPHLREVVFWRWVTAIYAIAGAAVVGFGLLTASGIFRPRVHS